MEYKKTERIIKFKRAYFIDEECKQFSHFKDWGVDINKSSFDSPSGNNYAQYFKDLQYFEIDGELFCEGDIIQQGHHLLIILFEDGSFNCRYTNYQNAMSVNHIAKNYTFKRKGNIYENSDLLS